MTLRLLLLLTKLTQSTSLSKKTLNSASSLFYVLLDDPLLFSLFLLSLLYFPFKPFLTLFSRIAEINRSKYLGGDTEHTHLVKGLDFALLERVKSDIAKKEQEEEERRRREREKAEEEQRIAEKDQPSAAKIVSDSGVIVDKPGTFKTRMGKALYTVIFVKRR